jgi:hypothetical protein
MEWKMLVYFMTIWKILRPLGYNFIRYSLWSLGIFFPFWYVWANKNLSFLTELTQIYFCAIFVEQNSTPPQSGTDSHIPIAKQKCVISIVCYTTYILTFV